MIYVTSVSLRRSRRSVIVRSNQLDDVPTSRSTPAAFFDHNVLIMADSSRFWPVINTCRLSPPSFPTQTMCAIISDGQLEQDSTRTSLPAESSKDGRKNITKLSTADRG